MFELTTLYLVNFFHNLCVDLVTFGRMLKMPFENILLDLVINYRHLIIQYLSFATNIDCIHRGLLFDKVFDYSSHFVTIYRKLVRRGKLTMFDANIY